MKPGPNCDEHQGIYTGDCFELSMLYNVRADLVFVDPPYEVGYVYGSGQSDRDMPAVDHRALVQRGLSVAPVLLITPGIANIWRYPAADWVICWHKPGSTGRSSCLAGFNTWEPVLVYGKPQKRIYQDSIVLPSVANLGKKDVNFHGCPKPAALMRWLIDQFTEPGDLVVDFMIGSGTAAVAAKELNRGWLGFELNPDTARQARERVKNTPAPLPGIYVEQKALL